jgi:hypothetical protein
MPTSEQLAREAAATREQLSRTIDELRLRASPSKLMENVSGFLRESADGVTPEARGPSRYMLPLAIIGAGLTWLALEARRSERVGAVARREQAEAEILPATEMDVIVAPASPTVAPDQGATLRPVETVSIAPEGMRADEKVDPDQRPLPL